MKYALLVAQNEFAANARTKGFWISIILSPLLAISTILAVCLFEDKATPTRHFILVDQSGLFERAIGQDLEKGYQRGVLAALNAYAVRYSLNATNGLANPKEGLSSQIPVAMRPFARISAQNV